MVWLGIWMKLMLDVSLCSVLFFHYCFCQYQNPHPKSLGKDWLELWYCKKVYFKVQIAALRNVFTSQRWCFAVLFVFTCLLLIILFNLIWRLMHASSFYLQAHSLWRHGIVSRRRVFKNPFGPRPKTAHMRWSHRYFWNALFTERHQLQHNALNYRQQRRRVSRARSVPAGLVVILCHVQNLTRWPTFNDISLSMC